jgi:hypothetical protein
MSKVKKEKGGRARFLFFSFLENQKRWLLARDCLSLKCFIQKGRGTSFPHLVWEKDLLFIYLWEDESKVRDEEKRKIHKNLSERRNVSCTYFEGSRWLTDIAIKTLSPTRSSGLVGSSPPFLQILTFPFVNNNNNIEFGMEKELTSESLFNRFLISFCSSLRF